MLGHGFRKREVLGSRGFTLEYFIPRGARLKSKCTHMRRPALPGQITKRHTGKGGKLNTNQAEPVAANSGAVGQYLSIYCEAFIFTDPV